MPSEALATAAAQSYASLQGYRAEILHFLSDPSTTLEGSYEHFEDGILVVSDGKIVACAPAEEVIAAFKDHPLEVQDNRPCLIMPGFIDAHIHFPQLDIIACHGEKLMDWLQKYTFPAEAQFADKEHSKKAAEIWVAELLRSGTTCVMAFATVHEESVDALFEEAQKYDMLMIAGKVMMDAEEYTPPNLRQEAEACYANSKKLIEKWHGKGRCLYAVTPRFPITSTAKQLELAGKLLAEHEGVYMHSQLNEDKEEIELVKKIHNVEDYLDVYEKAGLLGPRTVLAHCVHMTDRDWTRMNKAGATAIHCPSSNLFLGCGLFAMKDARKHNVYVGLGTDCGAGTSFCQLCGLGDAYKVGQLHGDPLSPFTAFHLATLGTAEALSLDKRIGNFLPGKEADFLVLDLRATPLLEYRMKLAPDIEEKLFLLSTLGDDRQVKHVYCHGKKVHDREVDQAAQAARKKNLK